MSASSYLFATIEGARTQLPVMSAARCGHLHTVCASCLPDWAADYDITLERTARGRALRAEAGLSAAEAETPVALRHALRARPVTTYAPAHPALTGPAPAAGLAGPAARATGTGWPAAPARAAR